MNKFNVFGKIMSVQRTNEQWYLYRESTTSMRVRVYDVVIPADLELPEITRFLDDIFHEYASEQYPAVFEIL